MEKFVKKLDTVKFDTILVCDKNRDNAKLWFEHIHDNVYKINTNTPFVLDYVRVILNGRDENIFDSFDPSGGPMINIGDKFGNKVLNKIFKEENNFYFELI